MNSRTIKDIVVTTSKKMGVENFRKTEFVQRLAKEFNKDIDELIIIPLKKPSGKCSFQITIKSNSAI